MTAFLNHDWAREFHSLLSLVINFGPVAVVAIMLARKKTPVTQNALIGVLVSTTIMLFMSLNRERRIEDRREEACQQLTRELAYRYRNDDEGGWSAMTDACKEQEYEPEDRD